MHVDLDRLHADDLKPPVKLVEEVEHWSLTTLRGKLIEIAARIVRHGRYVVFRLGKRGAPLGCLPARPDCL